MIKGNRKMMILVAILATCFTMQSHNQVQMLIDGEKDESRLIATNKPFNHKMLRNAYQMSKMTPMERKLFDFSERIKRAKLRRGDKQIQNLRKRLKRVKVFRTQKEIQKKTAKKNFLLMKYRPNRTAKLQGGLEKRAQAQKYGTPLNTLMKKKVNPFKDMVELQVIIDEAQEPEKQAKKKEKKEMNEMLKKRGMKGVVNHVKKI